MCFLLAEDFEIYENKVLLISLREGNREAFTRIYQKFWDSLYNSAYKRLKDKDACKDLVQNVFTDLWIRRDQVSINNLPAYLHTAVKFQVYHQALKNPVGSDIFTMLEEMLVSPMRSDSGLINDELTKLMQLWIKALPEKRRQIFLMHYQEELSTKEIADLLNLSQKTVQNQLNTATTFIKARFSHFLCVTLLVSHIIEK